MRNIPSTDQAFWRMPSHCILLVTSGLAMPEIVYHIIVRSCTFLQRQLCKNAFFSVFIFQREIFLQFLGEKKCNDFILI